MVQGYVLASESGRAGPTAAPEPARGERVFWELAFFAFAVASVYPLWHVGYAPIQDLPQHLAAIRVWFDHGEPALGFEHYFELDPWRTQYLAYYALVGFLSRAADVEVANRVVLTACMIGTPYALRRLLVVLGRDGRFAFLAFPLVYNAHLILGFFNFLAGIPLALWGIATAVDARRSPRHARDVGLALLALACFYAHVVPFALMALGVVLVAVEPLRWRSWSRVVPLLPACVAAVAWLRASPAGQATLTAVGAHAPGARAPEFAPWRRALAETPMWLTDVFTDPWAARILYAWGAVVLFAWLVAPLLGRRPAPSESSMPDSLVRTLGRRLSILAPLCLVLYFVAPTSYAWIWPIAPRFLLLALLVLILALPRPGRWGGHAVVAAAAVLASAHFHVAGVAFARFERDEVGDFDAALAEIPTGQRVAGLMFLRGSAHVRFSPFLHYVAYYQARKGGAVMFSFADFPQSPFRFRPHDRPPRVPPRWEWMPERVDPTRDLAWYDWVLVRGRGSRLALARDAWRLAWHGRRWSVWQRASSEAATGSGP
jgi:hypothetical protein